MTIALILIVIGGVALAVKLGLLPGGIWGWTWPILLIVLGLFWLVRRRRHDSFWWGCGPWRRNIEKDK